MDDFFVVNPVNRAVMPECPFETVQRGVVLSGFAVQAEQDETDIRQTAVADVAVEIRKHRVRDGQRPFENVDPFGTAESLPLDGNAVHLPQNPLHGRVDEGRHRSKSRSSPFG